MIARTLAVGFSSIAIVLFAAGTTFLASATEATVATRLLLLGILLVVYGPAPTIVFANCLTPRRRSETWIWISVGIFAPLCLFTSLGLGPGIAYLPGIPSLFAAAVAFSIARTQEFSNRPAG